MLWLGLGLGAVVLLLTLANLFAHARVETLRKVGVWGLVGLGVALLALLAVSGRVRDAILALVVMPALLFATRGGHPTLSALLLARNLWRLVSGWRHARQFASGSQAGGAGQESVVETATLAMRLDHATGAMSGRVLRGAHQGRELAELTLPELLALMADCRAQDPDSLPLIEAWLDRVAPEWREHEAHAAPPPATSGPMSRAEALSVLGLGEDADAAAIRAAHRRLMQAAHPDRGGSDWLAARINQARDVLLG